MTGSIMKKRAELENKKKSQVGGFDVPDDTKLKAAVDAAISETSVIASVFQDCVDQKMQKAIEK